MSHTYATRQRKTAPPMESARSGAVPAGGEPGGPSVLEGGMGSRLDELMQAKLQQHFLDRQIPQAEREADRLSAGLNARTPEEVKERLGERLGADFSAIRFHTDSGATRAADGIGARAYAAGGDIYFGQGGFDPAVAAHELVHTVQQGLVESSTPTVSAPTGQVQMMPGFLKRAGAAIREGASDLWRKTGGKLQRDNHDAMIELHEAIQSGDWDQLDEKDKKAWIRRNPIAYRRYMKSDEVKAQTEARIQKRREEQEKAEEFLQNMGPVHSSALGKAGRPGTGHVELSAGGAKKGKLDKAGDVLDHINTYAGDPAGIAKDALGDGLAKNITGGLSSGAALPGDIIGMVQSFREAREAFKNGETAEGVDAGAGFLSNTSSAISNSNTFLTSVAGVGDAAVGGLASEISGGINMVRGTYHAGKGLTQRANMNDFMKKDLEGKSRDELEGQDLLYRDMAALGKMQATKQSVEGISEAVTGAMDAVGGALDATGAGGVAGVTLHGLSSAGKLGTKMYSAYQQDRMKKKVVEQTTGITDEKIKEFMAATGITNFSRAKQALMKGLGYETGQRAELFADQTEKRSRNLARHAGRNESKAVRLAQGLGVAANKDGVYDEGKLFEAMGGQKSRSQIASKKFGIRARLADKRRRQAAARAGA